MALTTYYGVVGQFPIFLFFLCHRHSSFCCLYCWRRSCQKRHLGPKPQARRSYPPSVQPNAAPATARVRAPVDEATLTVVEKAVREVKRLAQETTVITRSMALCVQPTTCAMERVFSRTKLILRNHRKRMSMDTLEMITMLRYNRQLWDARWLSGLDDETVAMPAEGDEEDQFLDFIDDHDTDSEEGLFDNDADSGLDSEDDMNLDSPEESDGEEADI